MKRVITVSERELKKLATQLLDLMVADGFSPDVLIGIANGGAHVVGALPNDRYINQFTCRLQRPSTAFKDRASIGQRIVGALPYRVTDLLRVAEDRLAQRGSVTLPVAPPSLDESLRIAARAICEDGLRNIAVVDDAVDSGGTLVRVVGALRELLPPDADVRTAVITRTRRPDQTLLEPDYFLFESTLCRFHWAPDYRGVT